MTVFKSSSWKLMIKLVCSLQHCMELRYGVTNIAIRVLYKLCMGHGKPLQFTVSLEERIYTHHFHVSGPPEYHAVGNARSISAAAPLNM